MQKDKQKELKNYLRECRVIPNKISQWQLALDSDIKQSRISLIENCLVKPTNREKIRLSQALNKKTEEVFPENNENKNE